MKLIKKGNQTKCGLLLALFITLVLSFVVSFDTNALKYPISAIDIGDSTIEFSKVNINSGSVYGYFTKSHSFGIGFSSTHIIPDGFRFPHTWRFSGLYNSSTNVCELYQYSDGVHESNYGSSYKAFYINTLSDYTFSYYSLNSDDSPFDLSQPLTVGNNQWLIDYYHGHRLCSIVDYDYTSHTEISPPVFSNYPRWNWSSLINIPLVNERFAYEDSKPYYYAFNKIYIDGSEKVDGVVSKRFGVKMSDLFNTQVPEWSNLTFNFDLFNSPVNRLDYEGSPENSIRNFTLGGSIYFDSDYTFKDSDCTYNPTCIGMFVQNYNVSPNVWSDDLQSEVLSDGSLLYDLSSNGDSYVLKECSVTQYHISDGDEQNRLDFSCRYQPSDSPNSYRLSSEIDFRLIHVGIMFGGSTGYHNDTLSSDADYTFKDFYVVTNDDWTPTDWEASDNGSGGAKSEAPGYGVGGGGSDGSEPDFFESLGSMFNFSFINPFAPIFDMFSSNESCASIPTIAGLIHSESSIVCPWFDSNVRSIVTPILGLSSMMLVFGFAVRWLGSSSGNMFEDSGSHDISSSVTLKSRFRRK